MFLRGPSQPNNLNIMDISTPQKAASLSKQSEEKYFLEEADMKISHQNLLSKKSRVDSLKNFTYSTSPFLNISSAFVMVSS